jgi:hypothetical protein
MASDRTVTIVTAGRVNDIDMNRSDAKVSKVTCISTLDASSMRCHQWLSSQTAA